MKKPLTPDSITEIEEDLANRAFDNLNKELEKHNLLPVSSSDPARHPALAKTGFIIRQVLRNVASAGIHTAAQLVTNGYDVGAIEPEPQPSHPSPPPSPL